MVGENDNDEGNTGNDDQKNDVDVERFNQLAGVVEGLATGMKGLQDNVSGLTTSLQEKHDREDAAANEDDDDEDLDAGNLDLENMSRTDFAKHLIDQTVKRIAKEVVKPVSEKVDAVSDRTEITRLKKEFDDAGGNHKDFWDWKDEMREKSQANPYLSAEELYVLVRNTDSKKAKDLDEKYAKEDPNDDNGKGKKGKFGGLTPGGGGQTKKPTKMSQKQASDVAWDETMNDLDEGILSDGS